MGSEQTPQADAAGLITTCESAEVDDILVTSIRKVCERSLLAFWFPR
jgi:hypothetical protein